MKASKVLKSVLHSLLLAIVLLLCIVQYQAQAQTTYHFVTKWGTLGDSNGQFDEPCGVAVDSSGNVYVTELYNYRIQKFAPETILYTDFGSNGIWQYNGSAWTQLTPGDPEGMTAAGF
jgi:DNA-binding beta-propeller fold protein YncE